MQWASVLLILSSPVGQRNLRYKTVGCNGFKKVWQSLEKTERLIHDCARL